ncbi:hypothetical protein [Pseudomonas juntendi]|uniref:hypothetical protein n=1 Tax=Pseudomonas juntendi TaxID=2666183 RepID=UPI001F3AAA79|nr:hypothetical protein [Pseudomonas juntendi]
MSSRQGSAQSGEFLPGIIMPPEIHGLLRKRVAEIEVSDTATNCLIAQARAESLVEALEVLKAIQADAIERLYQLIYDSAKIRLAELGSGH